MRYCTADVRLMEYTKWSRRRVRSSVAERIRFAVRTLEWQYGIYSDT